MPKTTQIDKSRDSQRKAARAKLAKLKKNGEDVDLSIDEMREIVLDLMKKVYKE